MRKLNNEIIIYDIKKSVSKYQWKELNCFYRVFALALGSMDEKYFEAFVILVSLYLIYIADENSNLSFNADDDIIRYYNAELKEIFGTEIIQKDYSSYRNFKKRLHQSIADNGAVIVPCDLYYLPYSKTYLEQHRRHYLLIKGINAEKNIVYILDNMHKDLGSSTEYSDFIIDIDIVYRMNRYFCKVFDNSGRYFFWTILLKKHVKLNDVFCEYSGKVYEKLSRQSRDEDLNNDYELQICIGKQQMESRKYMELINTKILLFSAMKNMVRRYKDEKCLELCNKIDVYLNEREKFKIAFVLYIGLGKNAESFIDKIMEFKSSEFELFFLYNKVMKRNLITDDKKTEYIVSNRKNAGLDITAEYIHIILDSNTVYDIWKNSNDGVMVCYNVKEHKGRFRTIMKCKCDMEGSCHFGIIAILENGCKLLFGSLGRFNLAVHKIDDSTDYELFICNHIIQDSATVEIKFIQKNIVFYIDDEKKFLYHLEDYIKCYGVFAKTWEQCFCDVRYQIEKKET